MVQASSVAEPMGSIASHIARHSNIMDIRSQYSDVALISAILRKIMASSKRLYNMDDASFLYFPSEPSQNHFISRYATRLSPDSQTGSSSQRPEKKVELSSPQISLSNMEETYLQYHEIYSERQANELIDSSPPDKRSESNLPERSSKNTNSSRNHRFLMKLELLPLKKKNKFSSP